MVRVCVIGEPLAELSFDSAGSLRLGLGGDAANVAVRLARGRADVSLQTALGDDGLSSWLASRLRAERVELVGPTVADGRAGIYLIATDGAERSFTYWRDGSAASRFFRDRPGEVVGAIRRADVVHLSGITLALLDEGGRAILRDALPGVRERRTFVVFDPNHRPALWRDAGEAADATRAMLPLVDAALASRADCASLFGTADAAEGARLLHEAGVPHVVVTDGPDGCAIADEEITVTIEAPVPSEVVDTTGAGDTFDAAWILAWLRGAGPEQRARAGLEAAAQCVAHPGAID
jgi:2-dehydro-3-deoxygluconokinase